MTRPSTTAAVAMVLLGAGSALAAEGDYNGDGAVDQADTKILTDAVVEQYIPGRELYVSVLGNHRLQVLPTWELFLDSLPDDAPKIATRKVKWDLGYQEKHKVRIGRAKIALAYKDGAFGAISGVCNHVGGPLGRGRLDGDYVVCPWHNWKFHRATGLGEPGYEDDAVPSHAIRIDIRTSGPGTRAAAVVAARGHRRPPDRCVPGGHRL